jgi:hypothetical protein
MRLSEPSGRQAVTKWSVHLGEREQEMPADVQFVEDVAKCLRGGDVRDGLGGHTNMRCT